MKVVRALYGLKSSKAAWRDMFNTTVLNIGFASTFEYSDVNCKANTTKNG